MPVSPIANRPTSRASGAARSNIVDFEVLKGFEKVKSDDGSDILIELIDLYLRGTSGRIKEMRKAAMDCDWALLKRTAHAVKGSSSTLGLHQIAETCRDLETTSFGSALEPASLLGLLELQFLEASAVLIAERERRLRFTY